MSNSSMRPRAIVTNTAGPDRSISWSARSLISNAVSQQQRMTAMKLYGFPLSPNTWKVRAVIAHLGLPVEEIFVDLSKGEQMAPSYLMLNPTGRTPTLVDGDFVLWESTAIINYLASKKPSTLWP